MKRRLCFFALLCVATTLFAQAPTPEELRREYLEPNTTLREDDVDWRPVLEPIARELTQGCTTNIEKAEAINKGLWDRINVHYNTKRDKANQDPLHSMRIGMASCSGLTILFIDACRSIGVPARAVGCFWSNKPGNHTWAEIWTGSDWYVMDPHGGTLWFMEDAALATDDPLHAVYAVRATPNADRTIFPQWGVWADVVNDRYARKAPAEGLRVHIAAQRKGARVAVPFSINGVAYATPGPERDLNDFTVVTFPTNGTFSLEIGGRTLQREAEPEAIYVIDLDTL